MTQQQIDNLQLVGERVLVKRTFKPKSNLLVLPNGSAAPDMYEVESVVVKFSESAAAELIKEKIDVPINKKVYFATHMHPEAILWATEAKEGEPGEAYVIVNYRHIVGYDLSS